ncbi:MAG: hypothetical protein HFE39_05595 [Clostridiales bacterium]|nr:hypothetical protein [Clostridiales bacterium]
MENRWFYSEFNPIPLPFPIHGKGAALEDISPAAPGEVTQPGKAGKGKPTQAAMLRTLDCQRPPVLNSKRRRGYTPELLYKIRRDND